MPHHNLSASNTLLRGLGLILIALCAWLVGDLALRDQHAISADQSDPSATPAPLPEPALIGTARHNVALKSLVDHAATEFIYARKPDGPWRKVFSSLPLLASNEHLSIRLNENMRDDEDGLLALLESLPVYRLILEEPSENMVAGLSRVVGVAELYLSYNASGLTNESAFYLNQVGTLKLLNVDCRSGFVSGHELSLLTSLESLRVHDRRFNNKEVEALLRLPRLRELYLP